MTVIVVVMAIVLALSGFVVLYVAFPHRGVSIPGAPWLGEAMERAVEALPVMPVEDVPGASEGARTPR